MERKFLEGLGLGKEAINQVLDTHSAEIGRQKKLMEAAVAELDALKEEMDRAQQTLAPLAGEEPAALLERLQAAETALAELVQKHAGETALQQQETQQALAELAGAHRAERAQDEFEVMLAAQIAAMRGRNTAAIRALLDTDALWYKPGCREADTQEGAAPTDGGRLNARGRTAQETDGGQTDAQKNAAQTNGGPPPAQGPQKDTAQADGTRSVSGGADESGQKVLQSGEKADCAAAQRREMETRIRTALYALKKAEPYLFDAPCTPPPFPAETGSAAVEGDALREVLGI